MEKNMEAPERIWLDTKSDSEVWAWDKSCAMTGDVEYVRADLAAPSAPAEVEGLVERLRGPVARAARDLIDAYFKTGERKCLASIPARPDHDADLLLTAGIADAATALTALQAENERMKGSAEFWENCAALSEKRAEAAEAERDAWKANAEELRSRLVSWCGDESDYSEDNDTLAAHAKLKGEV